MKALRYDQHDPRAAEVVGVADGVVTRPVRWRGACSCGWWSRILRRSPDAALADADEHAATLRGWRD